MAIRFTIQNGLIKRYQIFEDSALLQRAFALDAATINRKDIRSAFNQITAKTLVVCGAEDQATPLELSEEIAHNIAHAQLHILEGVTHHPPIEAPETLLMVITNFIASNTLR